MSAVDIETKRKLREMNAGDLLAALETQDESLSMGLVFEERIRLLVDDAYSQTHSVDSPETCEYFSCGGAGTYLLVDIRSTIQLPQFGEA